MRKGIINCIDAEDARVIKCHLDQLAQITQEINFFNESKSEIQEFQTKSFVPMRLKGYSIIQKVANRVEVYCRERNLLDDDVAEFIKIYRYIEYLANGALVSIYKSNKTELIEYNDELIKALSFMELIYKESQ